MITLKKCPVCASVNIEKFIETEDFFLSKELFSLSKCRNCQLVFLNPRPNSEELIKYYQSDEYISHHSKGLNPFVALYRYLRKRNISYKYNLVTKIVKSGSLLDIGCGTGEFLNYFSLRNWQVKGIEPDLGARKHAKDEFGLDVFDENMLNDFANESLDVVTMWHVLEHVLDVNQRVKTVYRLLKKDGLFVVAVPNYLSWDAVHYNKYWAAYDVPRHLYHFSPNALINLVEKFNFKFLETKPLKYDSYYISLISEKYKKGRLPYLNGVINGLKSNIHAKKEQNYSSVIYFFRKN